MHDTSTRSVGLGQATDSPGVRIPPPVVYAAMLLVAWFIQGRLPLPFLSRTVALAIGIPLLCCGTALALTGVATMLRGKGTLNTNGQSAALVTTGLYRFTRNPMYLSLVLQYSGLACIFGFTWALLLLPLLIIYTQVGVIAREERHLERAFGQTYLAYKARVRRWL